MCLRPSQQGTSSAGNTHVEAGERWKQALEDYKAATGTDLLQSPFALEILSESSSDKVMAILKQFVTFRQHGGKILRVLKPTVNFVMQFLDAGAEAASVRISPRSLADITSLTSLSGCLTRRQGYLGCGWSVTEGEDIHLLRFATRCSLCTGD